VNSHSHCFSLPKSPLSCIHMMKSESHNYATTDQVHQPLRKIQFYKILPAFFPVTFSLHPNRAFHYKSYNIFSIATPCPPAKVQLLYVCPWAIVRINGILKSHKIRLHDGEMFFFYKIYLFSSGHFEGTDRYPFPWIHHPIDLCSIARSNRPKFVPIRWLHINTFRQSIPNFLEKMVKKTLHLL
jgi:hypothetical protein